VSTVAKNYFMDFFQKKNSVTEPLISVIQHSITDDDNALLTTPFTKEEFRVAMFSNINRKSKVDFLFYLGLERDY